MNNASCLHFSDVSTPLLLQTQRLDGVAMPKLGTSDPVKQHRSVLYIDGSCQKALPMSTKERLRKTAFKPRIVDYAWCTLLIPSWSSCGNHTVESNELLLSTGCLYFLIFSMFSPVLQTSEFRTMPCAGFISIFRYLRLETEHQVASPSAWMVWPRVTPRFPCQVDSSNALNKQQGSAGEISFRASKYSWHFIVVGHGPALSLFCSCSWYAALPRAS